MQADTVKMAIKKLTDTLEKHMLYVFHTMIVKTFHSL